MANSLPAASIKKGGGRRRSPPRSPWLRARVGRREAPRPPGGRPPAATDARETWSSARRGESRAQARHRHKVDECDPTRAGRVRGARRASSIGAPCARRPTARACAPSGASAPREEVERRAAAARHRARVLAVISGTKPGCAAIARIGAGLRFDGACVGLAPAPAPRRRPASGAHAFERGLHAARFGRRRALRAALRARRPAAA